MIDKHCLLDWLARLSSSDFGLFSPKAFLFKESLWNDLKWTSVLGTGLPKLPCYLKMGTQQLSQPRRKSDLEAGLWVSNPSSWVLGSVPKLRKVCCRLDFQNAFCASWTKSDSETSSFEPLSLLAEFPGIPGIIPLHNCPKLFFVL